MKDTPSIVKSPAGLSPVRRVLDNGASDHRQGVACHSGGDVARIASAPARCSIRLTLAGLAHFVSRTIDRGTTTRSADEIADVLDSRGVSLAVSVNRHAMSLICTCLVEDYAVIAGVLADILRNAAFPEPERSTPGAARSRRSFVRTRTIRPPSHAEALMALLYGARHPYGRPVRGSRRARGADRSCRAPAVSSAALSALRPLSLVIVGDLEPARAIDVAAEVLGGWQPDADATGQPDALLAEVACRDGAPGPGGADDEQVAGRYRLWVHVDHPCRSGVLRLYAHEQCARSVLAGRAARRQHPRAAGDGVLRVRAASMPA